MLREDDVAGATACFVRVISTHTANDDQLITHAGWLPVAHALGPSCFGAAVHADRRQLRHLIGTRKKLRDRCKRPPSEVLIEAAHDYGPRSRNKLFNDAWKICPEELRLFDGYCVWVALQHLCPDGVRVCRHNARKARSGAAHHLTRGDSGVSRGSDQKNTLPSNFTPAEKADDLGRLAAAHAASNHVEPWDPLSSHPRNPSGCEGAGRTRAISAACEDAEPLRHRQIAERSDE